MSDVLLTEWTFRLNAATRDLVKCVGGYERAAALCGRSTTQIGRWCDANHPDVIPMLCALLLQRDCGSSIVTQAMAEIGGETLAPRGEDAGAADLLATHAAFMHEAADIAALMAEAMADGEVTPAEQKKIDHEAAAAIERATRMRDLIAAAAGRVLRLGRK